MAEDVATTVAALEDERYAAMLSCDTAKLDCLLDDRLSCVYSSGRVDNKASYLSGFGRLWQRRSIDRQDQKIVPLGDTALAQHPSYQCPGRGEPAEGQRTRTCRLEQVRRRLAAGRRIFRNPSRRRSVVGT